MKKLLKITLKILAALFTKIKEMEIHNSKIKFNMIHCYIITLVLFLNPLVQNSKNLYKNHLKIQIIQFNIEFRFQLINTTKL